MNYTNLFLTCRNDELELPDGSYSVPDIPNYIEYIMRKHNTLSTNPHIHIYMNRIYKTFVQSKRYKLESQNMKYGNS